MQLQSNMLLQLAVSASAIRPAFEKQHVVIKFLNGCRQCTAGLRVPGLWTVVRSSYSLRLAQIERTPA